MPVIDRQRQFRQLGMIRLGYSSPGRNGGKTPKRSDTIRLTSPDRFTLDSAAEVFGGTVADFPQGDRDKFLLVTERTSIEIGVTRIDPTQWMEHWDGGTCKVRCDGETVHGPRGSTLIGRPCVCKIKYPDTTDRYEAGKSRQACKIVTRINVIIPEIPDIGVWRMDTRGEHAADELIMTIGIIQSILRANPKENIVPCVFALEWRKNVDKQPYPVPVIRLRQTYNEVVQQVLAGEQAQIAQSQQVLLSDGQQQKQLEGPEEGQDDIDIDGVFQAQEE